MALLRDGEVVREGENWQRVDDDALPSGDVTVSFARLVKDPALLEREGKTGVRLGPADDPTDLADLVERLDLVTVDFPKFTDGRGYSTARLLRRMGYEGELRAVGNVLPDQLFYMMRVGFDAFELEDGKSVDDALAAFETFSVTYQGSADDDRPLFRRVER